MDRRSSGEDSRKKLISRWDAGRVRDLDRQDSDGTGEATEWYKWQQGSALELGGVV